MGLRDGIAFGLGWEIEGLPGGQAMATHAAVGDLELGLLRTFLAVVRHGSLHKTAEAVELTQPAVSQQLFRLERIVGQKLFVRGRIGMTLTHHGDLLIAYASRAVELNEKMLVRLRAENGHERIALGMSSEITLAGLPQALEGFQSIHTNLEVKTIVGDLSRLEVLLKGGQLDLVIGDPSLLTGTPVAEWRVPLEWVACKDQVLDQTEPIPLVIFESPSVRWEEILESLRTAGRNWRVTFQSSSMDAILAAVQSGLGIAALPAPSVRNFRAACVKSSGLPPLPKIHVGLFRSDRQRGPYLVLEDFLASIFTTRLIEQGP
jgi:DNA-binding transcriptional LysR family regulator